MEQAGQARAAAALPREVENEALPPLHLSQAKNGRFKPKKESIFMFLACDIKVWGRAKQELLPSLSLPHSRIFWGSVLT